MCAAGRHSFIGGRLSAFCPLGISAFTLGGVMDPQMAPGSSNSLLDRVVTLSDGPIIAVAL